MSVGQVLVGGWLHEINSKATVRAENPPIKRGANTRARTARSTRAQAGRPNAEPDYPLACLQRWNGIRQYALDPREWQLDVHGTSWLVGDRVEHAAGAGAICEAH